MLQKKLKNLINQQPLMNQTSVSEDSRNALLSLLSRQPETEAVNQTIKFVSSCSIQELEDFLVNECGDD